MWPLAHARKAKPASATAPPAASVSGIGFARSRNSSAQAKPSGTRQRCAHVPPLRATRVHLDRLGKDARAPQPLARGLDHARHLDVHTDPARAGAPVAVRAAVNIVALDADVFPARTAVAPPLGRPEQAHHG